MSVKCPTNNTTTKNVQIPSIRPQVQFFSLPKEIALEIARLKYLSE